MKDLPETAPPSVHATDTSAQRQRPLRPLRQLVAETLTTRLVEIGYSQPRISKSSATSPHSSAALADHTPSAGPKWRRRADLLQREDLNHTGATRSTTSSAGLWPAHGRRIIVRPAPYAPPPPSAPLGLEVVYMAARTSSGGAERLPRSCATVVPVESGSKTLGTPQRGHARWVTTSKHLTSSAPVAGSSLPDAGARLPVGDRERLQMPDDRPPARLRAACIGGVNAMASSAPLHRPEGRC